jgi:hypothetical protein
VAVNRFRADGQNAKLARREIPSTLLVPNGVLFTSGFGLVVKIRAEVGALVLPVEVPPGVFFAFDLEAASVGRARSRARICLPITSYLALAALTLASGKG